MGWDFTEKTAERRKQVLRHNIKRDIKEMERKPKMKARELAKARELLAKLEATHHPKGGSNE
jgi:hypothetical protein